MLMIGRLRVVADTHDDYFPVLDENERFVGIFSAHDVREFTYDDTLHRLAIASDLGGDGQDTALWGVSVVRMSGERVAVMRSAGSEGD